MEKQPINWCRISSIHHIFSPWRVTWCRPRSHNSLALRLEHVPGSDPALAFALETPPGSWIGGKSSFKLPSWWLSWWLYGDYHGDSHGDYTWLYGDYMVIIWWLYGDYMVIIWWLYMIIHDYHGDYMVIIWWLYGDYMVIIWWLYGDYMVIIWWLYGDYMVITYEYMIIHGDYHGDYVYIYICDSWQLVTVVSLKWFIAVGDYWKVSSRTCAWCIIVANSHAWHAWKVLLKVIRSD